MEAIPAFLLEYGLLGLIILVLGWAYWQERKASDRLQEKRIEDLKELLLTVTGALNDSSNAQTGLANLIRDRRSGA